jgi:hypothetical protein
MKEHGGLVPLRPGGGTRTHDLAITSGWDFVPHCRQLSHHVPFSLVRVAGGPADRDEVGNRGTLWDAIVGTDVGTDLVMPLRRTRRWSASARRI